tara:strand:- start:1937 stop:2104 length:168 start_codon:yes stop_codon:yes gene_type:complete
MRTNLQKTNFLGKKFVDKSQFLVQPERLELSWGNPHLALNQACLPISAWPRYATE